MDAGCEALIMVSTGGDFPKDPKTLPSRAVGKDQRALKELLE